VKLHATLFQHGMAEYFLNNKSLSDFGIVPSKADGSLAIIGGFDLPKRTGTTFYNWPLENSVEPFVNADDIIFGSRKLKFSGTILGDANANIRALESYIDTLPELFSLSCEWGTWNVKLEENIQITPIDRNNSRVSMNFTEPMPDLSGSLPSPSGKNDIDGYSWNDFSLWLDSISGGQTIGGSKRLKVTQNKSYTLPSAGGKDKTEITVKATFICPDFSSLKSNIRSLYALISSPGLRKIRYRDVEYTCFAVDGFTVSDIILSDKTAAKFQCKFIVISKSNG
jgi:hypothetical protein